MAEKKKKKTKKKNKIVPLLPPTRTCMRSRAILNFPAKLKSREGGRKEGRKEGNRGEGVGRRSKGTKRKAVC